MAMFDALSGKLQGVFATLGRRGAISEKDLEAALREVRLALLEADVNYKVARDYIKAVRSRASTDEVMKSTTPLNPRRRDHQRRAGGAAGRRFAEPDSSVAGTGRSS